MTFYTTSPQLEEITLPERVTPVNTLTIDEITNNDIILTTGTMQDEFLIQSIYKRGIIPYVFMLKTPDDTQMNSFVTAVSFTLHVNSLQIENSFLDTCESIISSIDEFNQSLESYREQQKEEESEQVQFLYHIYNYFVNNSQLVNKKQPWASTRSANTNQHHSRKDYTIQAYTTQEDENFYLLLSKLDQQQQHHIKIFSAKKTTKEVLQDSINKHFDTIYEGEYNSNNELQKYSLKDITTEIGQSFILFDNQLKPLLSAKLDNTDNTIKLSLSANALRVYRLQNINYLSDTSADSIQKGLCALQSILNKDNSTIDNSILFEGLLNFIRFNKYAKTIYNNANKTIYNKLIKDESSTLDKSNENDNKLSILQESNENDDKLQDLINNIVESLYTREQNITSDTLTTINFALSLLKNSSCEEIKNLNTKIIYTCFKDIDASINIGRFARKLYNGTTEAEFNTFKKYINDVENCIGDIKEQCSDSDYVKELSCYPITQKIKDSKYLNDLINCLQKSKNCQEKIEQIKKIIDWNNNNSVYINDENNNDNNDITFETDKSQIDSHKFHQDKIKLIYYIFRTVTIQKTDNQSQNEEISNKFLKLILLLLGKNSIKDDSQYLCYFFFINQYHKDTTVKFELFLQLKSYIKTLFYCIDKGSLYPINQFLHNNQLIFSCTECTEEGEKIKLNVNIPNFDYSHTLSETKKKISDLSRKYSAQTLKSVDNFLMLLHLNNNNNITFDCNDDKHFEIIQAFLKIFTHYKDNINCEDDINLFLDIYKITIELFNSYRIKQLEFSKNLQTAIASHDINEYNKLLSIANQYLFEKDARLYTLYKNLAIISTEETKKQTYIKRALKIASFIYPEGHLNLIDAYYNYYTILEQKEMPEVDKNLKIALDYYLCLLNQRSSDKLTDDLLKKFKININHIDGNLLKSSTSNTTLKNQTDTDIDTLCYNCLKLLTDDLNHCDNHIAIAKEHCAKLDKILQNTPSS